MTEHSASAGTPGRHNGDFDEKELESLVRRWQDGDAAAGSELMSLMYGWLKRQASILLTKSHGQSFEGENRPLITTTELTHNLVLKLMEMQRKLNWQGRGRFLSFILTVMRNYLMDLAKSSYNRKRAGGDPMASDIDGGTSAMLEFGSGNLRALLPASDMQRMMAITEVFRKYEEMDPLRGQIVQLSVFCGAGAAEIARFFAGETELTEDEVEKHLRIAKVYLRREMARQGLQAI